MSRSENLESPPDSVSSLPEALGRAQPAVFGPAVADAGNAGSRISNPRLAHYEILERVGSGAMGVVWKARDTRLMRLVALKTLAPAQSKDAEFRARMIQEARAASQMDHPNICNIYQVEELPGDEIAIVMAFYPGKTLAEEMSRGPVAPDVAVAITMQILSGLEHAHRHGIVHRDVKPSNLIMSESGQVKIVDFGLAKEAGAGDGLTATGAVVGTVNYMSPEQVLCRKLDHRADLWACGVVLYEMLCGALPFAAESTYGVFEAILQKAPRPIHEHAAHLPRHLQGILETALHKDIHKRFQTAAEFLQALRPASETHMMPVTREVLSPADLHSAAAADRSLVVLPFTSPDRDEETTDFCDGLADEIITDLSAVRSLRIICSASSMRLRGSAESPRKIAQDLGVRYVLPGTVRLAPNSSGSGLGPAGRAIRVTAQLIDSRSDSLVWGDKYRGTIDDVFAIQETISRQIVAALKVTLSPEEDRHIEARPLPDVRAVQFYVKAKHEILKYSREGLDRALEYLDMGEQVVGSNVLLLSMRGQVYWQYVNAGISSDPKYLASASLCADQAAKLDPESSHVLRLQGLVSQQRGDFQQAVLLLKRAVAADPNDSDSLSWYSALCAVSGKAHAAMPLARRVLQIDPLTPVYRFLPGLLSLMAGEFQDALPPFDEAIRLDPGNALLLWLRGQALALAGQNQQAVAQFDALQQNCGDHYFCQLGNVLAAALRGDAAAAERECTPVFQEITRCDAHYSWALAEAYSLMGEQETACMWLGVAVDHGFLNYPMIAHWDPLLAGLRSYAGFAKLQQRARDLWESFEV